MVREQEDGSIEAPWTPNVFGICTLCSSFGALCWGSRIVASVGVRCGTPTFEDYFAPSIALACVFVGVPLAIRSGHMAFWGFVGLVTVFTPALAILTALVGWLALSLVFPAVAGGAAYAAYPQRGAGRRALAIILGTGAALLGSGVLFGLSSLAERVWSVRLLDIDPWLLTYVALFGPVMGTCIALPAVVFLKLPEERIRGSEIEKREIV